MLAVRQPLSEPTWEKPRVIALSPPAPPVPEEPVSSFLAQAARLVAAATPTAAVRKFLLLSMFFSFEEPPAR